MANYYISQLLSFFVLLIALHADAYPESYSMERLHEELQYSRSKPLDYIESKRLTNSEKQHLTQSSELGMHNSDRNCKTETSGDFKIETSCTKQLVVNLELKCSTSEDQEAFDVLVPFRFKDVEIDIVDKSLEAINGGFPMKMQSGSNGELSFSVYNPSNNDFKFILRRNKKEISLSGVDAANPIKLPSRFCFN